MAKPNNRNQHANRARYRKPRTERGREKGRAALEDHGALLGALLEGIGTPEAAPLSPDQFQLEALAAIEHEDVLVTAPTGSGKTWIAREEMRRLLESGRRAWYTSPLKALTNSKYAEFREAFGESAVGILTGDRRENSDASIIVCTTEIYRNQLFDALRNIQGEVRADLVVLDEAHYLGDEERGHVWEEAIILSPPRVRLLLLSATIGNAGEFARWIAEVRGHNCRVVSRREEGGARPVPLRAAFLYPDGRLQALFDSSGQFSRQIAAGLNHEEAARRSSAHPMRRRERFGHNRGNERLRSRVKMPEIPPPVLLQILGSYNLLPAIVFLPTRRRCDEAATEAAVIPRRRNEAGSNLPERRMERLRELSQLYPEIARHRQWNILSRGGVASHHAGHLPSWKLVIEDLMSAGLLDAIFATATVAAGVDFPARSVVLSGVEIRTGDGWRSLQASEVQQMTGRAGRRGRDKVGFVIAAPGPHQQPEVLAALLRASPDPLESHFRATYTTLLNLTDAYGRFSLVRDVVARGFLHRGALANVARLRREAEALEAEIAATLENSGSDFSLATARGLELLLSARSHLLSPSRGNTAKSLRMEWLHEVVLPGRLVTCGRGGRLPAIVTSRKKSNFRAVIEDGSSISGPLSRIGRVYAQFVPADAGARESAFTAARSGQLELLHEPRLEHAHAIENGALELLDALSDSVLGKANTGAGNGPEEALWSALDHAAKLRTIEQSIQALEDELWLPFERRARVLDHYGYLDLAHERVSERGRLLADLRLDYPLLIGETLHRGLFSELDAATACGLMAAVVSDPDRAYGEIPIHDRLISTLARFDEVAYEIGQTEWEQGIEPAPEINFSAASCAARWASGAEWKHLTAETRAEEGDLFRMLSRTGEALLQIAALGDALPETAQMARRAAKAILRSPVRTDDLAKRSNP